MGRSMTELFLEIQKYRAVLKKLARYKNAEQLGEMLNLLYEWEKVTTDQFGPVEKTILDKIINV